MPFGEKPHAHKLNHVRYKRFFVAHPSCIIHSSVALSFSHNT